MRRSVQSVCGREPLAILVALTVTTWAVLLAGTAPSSVRAQASRIQQTLGGAPAREDVRRDEANLKRDNATRTLPAPVRFREESGRGLIVRAWINGAGPYTFALDTGAGGTIISARVASEARVSFVSGRGVPISGLSGAEGGTGREANVNDIALGERNNRLPGRATVLVTDSLPPDLDGVLDPSESYYPLGYTIDLPANLITAFDPRVAPLRAGEEPAGGAVVRWLTEGGSRRPFVQLDNGRRALIDTGSNFGLAVQESAARSFGVPLEGRERAGVRDLGRGRVAARRIAPATVQVGALVLRRVPTDLLHGAAQDAPVILGRDALRPFRLSFDPLSRLIRIAPR